MKLEDNVLVGFSILIVLLFWMFIMIILYQNPRIPHQFLNCPAGYCATNLQTGQKRCPINDNNSLLYESGVEVCNPKTLCRHPPLIYAIQNDGSTNNLGLCQNNQNCPCVIKPRCNRHVVSYFKNLNNDIPTNDDSLGYYGQIPFDINNTTYNDPYSEFCYINTDYLTRLTPRTNLCNDINNINKLKACINSNPCNTGIMAVINSEIAKSPGPYLVSCFRNQPNFQCASTQLPYWNETTNTLACI